MIHKLESSQISCFHYRNNCYVFQSAQTLQYQKKLHQNETFYILHMCLCVLHVTMMCCGDVV